MKLTTITSKNGIEEIAGKSLSDVLALAEKLGHSWPLKSSRQFGVWVNTYKINSKKLSAA